MDRQAPRWRRVPRSVRWAGALLVFAVGVISVRHSITDDPDFRTNVWDAGRAIARGSDPYNVAEFHRLFSDQGWMPTYGPPHLWLALVVAVFPLGAAIVLWFLFNLAGMVVIAAVAVRSLGRDLGIPAILTTAGILILSRGGRGSFHQVTVFYVLATYVAWSQVRTRPWLAAFAVAVAMGKPPFGLPLLCLLMFCGLWRVALRALSLFLLACLPILVWLSVNDGSPLAVWHAMTSNLRYSNSQPVDRIGAVRRIDAINVIGRYVSGIGGLWEIIAFIVLIGLVSMVLRRRSTHPGWNLTPAVLLTLGLVSLLSIAHQDYDLLLLAWPFAAVVGVVWSVPQSEGGKRARAMLLLATPALVISYLPAATTAKYLGFGTDVGVIATLTTASLLLALAGSLAAVLAEPQPSLTVSTATRVSGRRLGWPGWRDLTRANTYRRSQV